MNRLKRITIWLAVATLLGACGSDDAGLAQTRPNQAGACEDLIVFGGREYVAVLADWSREELALGREVRGARLKCQPSSATRRVPRAIRAVTSRVALTDGTPVEDRVYIAPGSFVLQPNHPFHRVLAERAPDDVARAGCRIGSPRLTKVDDVQVLGFSIRLLFSGSARTVRIDSRTSFRGFGHHVAILNPGDRVRVTTGSCTDSRKPLAISMRLISRR
jgi:hypothetical protein